jgi:hypothetical protein
LHNGRWGALGLGTTPRWTDPTAAPARKVGDGGGHGAAADSGLKGSASHGIVDAGDSFQGAANEEIAQLVRGSGRTT